MVGDGHKRSSTGDPNDGSCAGRETTTVDADLSHTVADTPSLHPAAPAHDTAGSVGNSANDRRPNGPLRVHSDRLFGIDNDFQPALPSPPYKQFASTSHLPLEYDAQTPPYHSSQDQPLMSDHDQLVDEKKFQFEPEPERTQKRDQDHKTKHSVHYPADVDAPAYRSRAPSDFTASGDANAAGLERPGLFGHGRQDSFATDVSDEDEDYDWSAEEDLIDEETKFEERMGRKTRPRGWFRR